MKTIFDLMTPGTEEEFTAIRRELLALEPWYKVSTEALERHTLMLWIDRRTRPTSAIPTPDGKETP